MITLSWGIQMEPDCYRVCDRCGEEFRCRNEECVCSECRSEEYFADEG